jgi:nucleoside-specific outer membrane channel protein Tsx
MNKLFKEHFRINGGTFKTHEDEVEAYVKKMIKDFYIFIHYSNSKTWPDEQKDILAEQAYGKYIKNRDNE